MVGALYLDFEWDERKGELNLRKHGVDFVEAASVFYDPLARTISDPEHSTNESRWITMGRSRRSRVLLVVHTFEDLRDGASGIRIISARKANRRERRSYEDGT
jgi:hypothetical protein